MSDSQSSEDETISKKELLKRLNKLERKYRKTKRRHSSGSRPGSKRHKGDHRSLRGSRSPAPYRSRSPGPRGWKPRSRSRSPRWMHTPTYEDNDGDRDYRSPSGSEFREGSGDRGSHISARNTPAQPTSEDHRPSPVAATVEINNARPAEATQNSPLIIHIEEDLPDEFLEILGEDPANREQSNFCIHPALGNRWGYIIQNGLAPTEIEKMSQQYPLPNNYSVFTPPVVNVEIKNILSGTMTKRDDCYLNIQTEISRALTALAKGANEILEDKENIPKGKKTKILEYLSDSGKILSNLSFKITSTRREIIMPNLSKPVKEMVEKIPATGNLFGEELGEKLKNLKYLERASKDLKPEQPATSLARGQTWRYNKPKRIIQSQPQARRYTEPSLNRKRPARLPRESRAQKGHTSKTTSQRWSRRRHER